MALAAGSSGKESHEDPHSLLCVVQEQCSHASKCSRRFERSAPAKQSSAQRLGFAFFQELTEMAMPIGIVLRFCAVGAVGLISSCTVAEIHRVAKIRMLRLNIGSWALSIKVRDWRAGLAQGRPVVPWWIWSQGQILQTK